jgi:predicted RNA binding protein YcfA (HicA-like mRNA interferase family)
VPRLGKFSGDEIVQILELAGFVRARQKGSHCIMQKRTGEQTVTVPVPMHKEIKIGTLQSIIRQTGIPKENFFR